MAGPNLDLMRQNADQAEERLRVSVVAMCGEDHVEVQHRDRMPPWCPHCGRDARGVVRRG